jgi:hypothetical protein
VNPDYIASRLSQLPRFKIEDIDHGPEKYGRGKQMLGRFSEPPKSKDQNTTLILPDLRSITGILHISPETEDVRIFQQHDNWPNDITDEELLSEPLAYLGRYGEKHVTLALDTELHWIELSVPPDESLEKVRFTDGEGEVHCVPLKNFGEQPLPEGAEVFQASWNHWHCSFCWERIESGEFARVVEYPNGTADQVCPWCYSNAVSPHDLRALLVPLCQRK